MSAISSPAPAVAKDDHGLPPVPPAEIDFSCRPIVLMFASAAVWLLVASALGMVATLKFHAPGFLGDCAWFTYGRVHPAAMDSLVYGFAMQSGLAVALWLLAHLGRTRLASVPGILVGTAFWNTGVVLGILGILAGENTGFEWLEIPRYGLASMFVGYVLIGVAAMHTFRQRREKPLYISQWFLLAATFWFPWIFTMAGLLLVAKPVRGVMQAVIDGWYVTNLNRIWLGFIGLAAIFYFVPKFAKRPLHSHYLGIFIFWTLALFGSWGAVPTGAPLPSWIPALGSVAAVLTLVPVLGVAMNVKFTTCGQCGSLLGNPALRFVLIGVAAYLLAGLSAAVTSLYGVSEVTNFTWYLPAQTQLYLYGFFAMVMFGAAYIILPQLLGAEFSPGLITLHFVLAAGGIVLYVVPLALGGIAQGEAMNLGNGTFLDVVTSSLTPLRISTLGDLAMAMGHLVFFVNLLGVLARVGKKALSEAYAENFKTAEATR
jgi:cytochrome c oxidase cbb3-type subunit I